MTVLYKEGVLTAHKFFQNPLVLKPSKSSSVCVEAVHWGTSPLPPPFQLFLERLGQIPLISLISSVYFTTLERLQEDGVSIDSLHRYSEQNLSTGNFSIVVKPFREALTALTRLTSRGSPTIFRREIPTL